MIKPLKKDDQQALMQVARLLQITFPWAYGIKEDAMEEAESLCVDERIAYVYLKDDQVLGIVGARPQYGTTGWELHPLAVHMDHRQQGIASSLMHAIEAEVIDHGGIVMYLGSDDEFDQTSLSTVDLFEHPFEKILTIENISHHPYSFYEKHGYQIVGVVPDANGFYKPDIIMAKRLVPLPPK